MGTNVNLKMAISSFFKSVENGNIAGKCLLGYCYQKGKGTEKDDEKLYNGIKNQPGTIILW